MKALLVALLVLLAGCTGRGAEDEGGPASDAMPATPAQDAPAADGTSSEPAPASGSRAPPSSNATAAPGRANATPEAASPRPAPERYEVPVQAEGALGRGVTRCQGGDGGGSCASVGEPSFSHEVGVEDPLASYELTLTWEAATPLAAELTLLVLTCGKEECGETSVTGASPLTLRVPDAGMRGRPLVVVRAPDAAPGVWAGDGTEVRVEGKVVAVRVDGHDGFAGRSWPYA